MIEESRRKIGGSDTSAILGVSPFAKPSDVVARIVHGIAPTKMPEVAEHGTDLEPGIFRMIERALPAKYEKHPVVYHPDFEGGVGHLDLWDKANNIVVDAKAIHWRARHRWVAEDGGRIVPDYVRLQLDWYMACTGAQRAYVGAFFGLGEFELIPVNPLDAETRGNILETMRKFWRDHILGGIPVPPDGGKGFDEVVKKRLATADDVPVVLTGTNLAAAEGYIKVRNTIKTLEAQQSSLAQILQSALAEANSRIGVAGSVRVKFSSSETRTTDWKALALSLGPTEEEIERFSRTRSNSRLSVTQAKGDVWE